MNFAAVLASRLAMAADPAVMILTFFAYSFGGYIMECIVLSAEKKQVVINRGFTSHLPFCIIYGAGAMLGFIILSPLYNSPVLLYLVGAVLATGFEYTVGTVQTRLFGSFWWDYHEKPFNYKGMICLESSIFWGFVALIIIRHLHFFMVEVVGRIPKDIASVAAILLLGAYVLDFIISARQARLRKARELEERLVGYESYHTVSK